MKRFLLLLSVFVSFVAMGETISVMSFNVRYDNSGDGENSWQFRKDRVGDAINFYRPDIIGTQETLYNQIQDIKAACPDYDYVGVGRQDGKTAGEYSAVWYNKNRFDLVDSGNFWLSETPEVAGSKGWDGACERIASWAILHDRQSGMDFFAIDTHLDHIGVVARTEGISLLLDRIGQLSKGLPVISTGDFNSYPDDPVIAHMTNGKPVKLTDSRQIAKHTYGPEWTYHDFGRLPLDKCTRIDYVFVTDDFTVDRYATLAESVNGCLSDHNPIIVYLDFKKI